MEPKNSFINSLINFVKKPFQPSTLTVHNPVPRTVRIATSSSPAQGVAPLNEYKFDRDDFAKRIAWNESRGEGDPYKAIGPTKDLGKYQASPDTLKGWSQPWLDKQYDEQSFLADPDAQERFFEEYMNVAEAYKLKPEEAAIAWHKGWGALGNQKPRAEREKEFREHIARQLADPANLDYLTTFRNYGQ